MRICTIGIAIGAAVLIACNTARAPATAGVTPTRLDSAGVAAFERRIERAQVVKDSAFLDSATDASLRFTHGGGTNVQSKDQWLRGIVRGTFYERSVSDQHVELHGDLAVTTGEIRIRRPAADSARANYTIWYVRVYRCTSIACKLVSHVTTRSTLLPSPLPTPPNER